MNNGSSSVSLGKARATPSKEFFVNMLTRDIELDDAILDLLDNCLDGVLRSESNLSADKPYKGFWARITMSSSNLIIEDNCGGIPLDVAKNYAFAMGRPPENSQEMHSTIGMYGIGMKRAIFKMGRRATVTSKHREDGSYRVEISPEWMADPEWRELDILEDSRAEGTPADGTRIVISDLNDETQRYFSNKQAVDKFRTHVRQHYALILSKGFSVSIGTPEEFENGSRACDLKPMDFKLIHSRDDDGIKPIIYRGEIDGVSCEIYAGLNRPLMSAKELDDEESQRSTNDDSGWIIACNDRVVVWRDKTRLTGWGEAGVPNFHGQFLPISGIVLLSSANPMELPLTTTKRGIDGSSAIYSKAKDLMRSATLELTRFTNRWKKFSDERDELYEDSDRSSLRELRQSIDSGEIVLNRLRKTNDMEAFKPRLPEPEKKNTHARISYLALKNEVALAGEHLFGDAAYSNSDVGRRSFELIVESAGGYE